MTDGGIILVRHSKPAIDPVRPAHRWELSGEGRRLAEELAERLASLEPDAVYTSSEPKAKQTGAVVAERLELPIAKVTGLGEHQRRTVPCFPSQEEFRRRVKELFDYPELRVFGEESAGEALERFSAAVESILEKGEYARPVAVTHGTVMSLYLSARTGRSAWELWNELTMPCWVDLGSGTAPVVCSLR